MATARPRAAEEARGRARARCLRGQALRVSRRCAGRGAVRDASTLGRPSCRDRPTPVPRTHDKTEQISAESPQLQSQSRTGAPICAVGRAGFLSRTPVRCWCQAGPVSVAQGLTPPAPSPEASDKTLWAEMVWKEQKYVDTAGKL